MDAYLIKGHTHEDMDQHFSVMSSHISAKMNWDTPQEMAGHVQQRMARHLHPLPVSAGKAHKAAKAHMKELQQEHMQMLQQAEGEDAQWQPEGDAR